MSWVCSLIEASSRSLQSSKLAIFPFFHSVLMKFGVVFLLVSSLLYSHEGFFSSCVTAEFVTMEFNTAFSDGISFFLPCSLACL